MQKELLKEFSPWIAFTAIIGLNMGGTVTAAIVALALIARFYRQNLKNGFILEWGGLIFFISVLFMSFIPFMNALLVYSILYANLALALIAWFSLFIGQPFTMQYAKKTVSPGVGKTALFKQINCLCTLVWAVLFSFMVIASVVVVYHPNLFNVLNNYLPILLIIVGIYCMDWLPSYLKGKIKPALAL